MSSLKSNVRSLGGIYKRFATPLEKLGITTLEDFLFHVPSRYDDFRLLSKISDIQPGEVVTLRGEVIDVKNQFTRSRFTIQKLKLKDESGEIDAIWFNQPYITRGISIGDKISISGKAEYKINKLQIANPVYEIGTENFIHTGRIVPIYPETRGITSKWIRRQTHKLLTENKNEIEDVIPEEIISNNGLSNYYEALLNIHFPNELEDPENARKRLSFDELFLTQLAATARKKEWNKKLIGNPINSKKYKKEISIFIKSLPFKLTSAQENAIDEIFKDLSNKTPMNRLLQGDVGSGKTIVAGISMYVSFLNGFQSVIMAPTEILANQHYKTLSTFLNPMGLKIKLLTSSQKKDDTDFNILIGTHSVISKNVNFNNLGLVIIDEQQRFGVEQRGILKEKGKNPHLLTMTATPIPRTIALTLYGDLDLSVLNTLPKGRKEIKTWLVPKEKRDGAYDWIKKQIKENGSQVFIICPFIEESESMSSVRSAVKEYETLRKDIFKDFKLNLLHGKIKSKEKDQILLDFHDKKFDILIATPVVEVGIDIPGADIILIEGSERFGLSGLHQLRGRVGRNERQAYCLLFSDATNVLTNQRLKAMEKTNIGSELAEMDLKIRGAGEIYGTKQSGRNSLKIATFSDLELIKITRKESENISEKLDKYPKLHSKIKEINIKTLSRD